MTKFLSEKKIKKFSDKLSKKIFFQEGFSFKMIKKKLDQFFV